MGYIVDDFYTRIRYPADEAFLARRRSSSFSHLRAALGTNIHSELSLVMTSPTALNKSMSWDQRSLSTISSHDDFSHSWANNPSPPWALDEEKSSLSRSSLQSRGFRDGGPKEARLKRVAFLSLEKDIAGTYPVKVQHLPLKTSPEKLKDTFQKSFSDIRDVYVPMSPQKRVPVADFAIVRFDSPSSAMLACQSPSSELDGLSVSPLSKQRSFFSGGTGYHGIHNEPVDDGTYVRGMKPVQQDISLESCMSRSGYPWGSFRELKFLAPHITPEARETFALRIDNLDRKVT